MPALEEYLSRPMAPPAAAALAAVEGGPIDPADALPESQIGRLLDPAPLPAECGYCWLPDGVGYVAMRTAAPGVTAAMVEWWFEWHPVEDVRYRVWHPRAHVSNRADPPARPGEKPYWGSTHHPVEDIGTGVEHLRIEFVPPWELGFARDALERPGVMCIVGGFAGDDKRRVRHTRMVHVFFEDPATGATVQRSRFWIGSSLRPYAPAIAAAPVAALINRPLVRNRMIPRRTPQTLARHCAEEFAQLAAILPGLYAEYGPGVA